MLAEFIATLIRDKNNFYKFYESSLHVWNYTVLLFKSAYVIAIKKIKKIELRIVWSICTNGMFPLETETNSTVYAVLHSLYY